MERIVRIKKADIQFVDALTDIVSEATMAKIKVYKPRFSRTIEVTIQGSAESVDRALAYIARFASKVGWQLE